MIILKELEVRNNGQRGYMWALFKCPTCGAEIERMKHQGKAQIECTTCARRTQTAKVTTHGGRHTRLYRTWINMRSRCNNPKSHNYDNYGGKGVSIDPRWDDFTAFKTWSLANGYADELTIDRLNVGADYAPGNIQFIPNAQNAGKDKVKVTEKMYKEILVNIATGLNVKDSYEGLGVSRTAYYNAKKRYKDV